MKYLHLFSFISLTLVLVTVLSQDPADLVADLPGYPYKAASIVGTYL